MEFLNTDPTRGRTDKAEALKNVFLGGLSANKIEKAKSSRPEFARFKLKIYWLQRYKDPLVKYSEDFEWVNGKRIFSEKAGYMELREIIVQEHKKDSFTSAMLWISLDPICATDKTKYDLEVIKKVRGKSGIFNPNLKWEGEKAIILIP